MIIIFVGKPHATLPLVEQLAADHGGLKELRMSSFTLRARCEDGSVIDAVTQKGCRGHKADEVWVSSAIDKEVLTDIITPMLMGHFDNLHYFSEKGF